MELLLILFRSGLPQEEVVRNFKERANKYREVRGLVQKYYLHDESSGEFGGMYLFDSKENLEAFRNSDLAKSIGTAQRTPEPPTRKVFTVNHVLYEDTQ
jgi:heme-degrading monooxygenase HmoA